MGGQFSLHGDDEEGRKENDYRRNYPETIDDTDPLTGEAMRSRCSYWFSRAMKARIVYVTLLGCFVGLGIPLIMYFADKPTGQGEIFGSCLLRNEFRYKCLINKQVDPTEDECIDALCCWENNDTLPFKCYHSLNSAYQYNVVSFRDSSDGEQFEPENTVPGESFEIKMEAKHGYRMSDLTAKLIWIDSEHLNIQICPSEYQNCFEIKTPPHKSDSNQPSAENSFNVTFSETPGDYFYIRIGRANETIFDTSMGPLISTPTDFSFATVLPSPYFYGLPGGHGGGPVIYDVVNGYNNMDLPFYMPQEMSGKVHGVLFENKSPFIVQFTEAPGLMFHFEGNEGNHVQGSVNMHFFIGPTAKDVSRQLSSHLAENEARYMPPYWGLGLHLCRHLLPGESAQKQIEDLERGEDSVGIPYDSDCVDLNLRTPFQVDDQKYNTTIWTNILSDLNTKKRRLLLTQLIGLQEANYANDSSHPSYFINNPNKTALLGINNGDHVYFPNLYHANWIEWLATEFEDITMHSTSSSSGLVLTDNFPFSENSNKSCVPTLVPRSRLEEKFLGGREGLVCPDAKHFLSDEMVESESKSHFQIHNEFGHLALRAFRQVFNNQKNSTTERIIMTSSSVRPNTFSYGGFNGLTVPFTWNGMVDSLTHILRNFMLFPFAGTPICGNYIPADAQRNDDELCLRWFQLGLLLPFSRNTYGKNITRGPLEFNKNDQKNLIDSIQERYRYTPYYYTLFHKYVETGEPVIRPMIYDFHEEPPAAFNLLTQFMIGPALMAAPVLSKAATTRDVYFPPGTWYEVTGAFVYGDLNEGAILTIPGLASMTPLFILSGHIIPTLTKPDAATAEKSRLGKYTILATYPDGETSNGSLFVDDGVNIGSDFHFVHFEMSNTSITISSNCSSDDQTGPISKSIDQIKIYGFPGPKPRVKTSVPDQIRPEVLYTEEDLVLRMKTFSFDWCTYPSVTFTWIYD